MEPVFSVESYRTASHALRGAPDFHLLVIDGPARGSAATLEIGQKASLVVQPTGASLDDLYPAVLTFHELNRVQFGNRSPATGTAGVEPGRTPMKLHARETLVLKVDAV